MECMLPTTAASQLSSITSQTTPSCDVTAAVVIETEATGLTGFTSLCNGHVQWTPADAVQSRVKTTEKNPGQNREGHHRRQPTAGGETQETRFSGIMADSADMEQLLAAFKKFAVRGDTKAMGKELNGKNWAKLCKDCKIIDGKSVSVTDVDIVFSKVKQKTSRVITFEEFHRALQELAPKRFKGQSKEEALRSIVALVEGGEPSNAGVTKWRDGAVDRLTDAPATPGHTKNASMRAQGQRSRGPRGARGQDRLRGAYKTLDVRLQDSG
ncbi:unnamed protein product [Pleuronectes platessa]|uniref:Tubulin polymerization-promoting protein family member 3 n=1 Tax=Pleuronectes platessa TaxID=8262 RepID=A0A9N7UNX1_PLEPL|nr:unnamed protein product [Pleuronectes platessa]